MASWARPKRSCRRCAGLSGAVGWAGRWVGGPQRRRSRVGTAPAAAGRAWFPPPRHAKLLALLCTPLYCSHFNNAPPGMYCRWCKTSRRPRRRCRRRRMWTPPPSPPRTCATRRPPRSLTWRGCCALRAPPPRSPRQVQFAAAVSMAGRLQGGGGAGVPDRLAGDVLWGRHGSRFPPRSRPCPCTSQLAVLCNQLPHRMAAPMAKHCSSKLPAPAGDC